MRRVLELERAERYCLFAEIEWSRGKDDDLLREMEFLRVILIELCLVDEEE